MVAHERRRVSAARGVEGDFRGKPGRRQVTVLAREAWEAACADVGHELGWTTRRANLLVEGVELTGTAGQQLRMADGAVMDVSAGVFSATAVLDAGATPTPDTVQVP